MINGIDAKAINHVFVFSWTRQKKLIRRINKRNIIAPEVVISPEAIGLSLVLLIFLVYCFQSTVKIKFIFKWGYLWNERFFF